LISLADSQVFLAITSRCFFQLSDSSILNMELNIAFFTKSNDFLSLFIVESTVRRVCANFLTVVSI